MNLKIKIDSSLFTIIIIFLICLFVADYTKMWCVDTPFCSDSKQYYSYLPKFFLEHDMKFNNRGDYWLNFLPDGKPYIKYSCGLAILQAPFFFIALLYSSIFDIPLEGGYSSVFVNIIHYGTLFYFLIGLLSLRKVLKHFHYSETATSITLIAVFFGTNLFHYILGQGLMTHGFLFSLHCVFLWLTINFYEKASWKNALFLGLIGGLIALIRPTEVICFAVWLLWSVTSFKAFKERIMFLVKNYYLLLIIAVSFVLVWIPQLVYWNYVSGHLFIDAYAGEKLFFADPKIYKVLFSARSGLFPYCPVMLLFFIGIFFPNPNFKSKIIVLIFIALNIYVVSCWWCWWYGGSYSMRALIQIFPYLSIFFAGMLHYMFSNQFKFKVLVNGFVSVLIVFFVFIQMKLWYQAKNQWVSFDSMTTKSYLYILPKINLTFEEQTFLYSTFNAPDYQAASKGKRDLE